MVSRKRLLSQLLHGTSDSSLPFDALCSLLRSLGFEERIRGSHHIFTRPGMPEILNLQPKRSKAKAYQVRQVRDLILRHHLAGETGDE